MSAPENAPAARTDDLHPALPAEVAEPRLAPALPLRPAAPPPGLLAAPNAFALLRALRRRWLLAGSLGLAVGVAAAAAVWVLLPPAKNSAEIRLQVNVDEKGLIHEQPDRIANIDSFNATQQLLIRGPLVLNAALNQPGIAQLATMKALRPEECLDWLEREVRVDFPSREMLRITVSGDDVEDLKKLANAVAEAYLTEVVQKQTRQRQTRLEELRKIQARYKDRLSANRRVKRELATKAGAADTKTLTLMTGLYYEQEAFTRQQLVRLRDDIRKMEVSERQAAARGDLPADIPPQMVDALLNQDQVLQKHRVRIAELEDQLEKGQRVARDPNMKGLQRIRHDLEAERLLCQVERNRLRPQIESRIRDSLAEQAGYSSATLKNNLAHAKALEKSLEADLEKYRKAIQDAPGGQLSLQEMDFDINQAEEEVRLVTAEISKLDVEKDDPPRVIKQQGAVDHKVDNTARKAQLAAAAGAVGLGLAVVGVALLEFRSRRVNSVDEVTQGLGVRVVGTVPAPPRGARTAAATDPKAVYWKSMLAESVDAARTLLLHHARREGLRIVMVTSACGGEGKTSLSSHLAVSMARSGRKTLLIDCDLRNPSAHKLFNVPLEPGLSSVLRGEIPVEEALHPTGAAGLWLMPAGACDGAALTMLAQDGVQSVFERLRREFDFIVIDSSPVLPVADSLMVAQQVDGVLFAILREVSRLPKVHEAYQKLLALGVRMLGAVVNGTSGDLYGYGYGYGYGKNGRYLTASKQK